VPLEGDPSIQHLAIDPAAQEELDEGVRLEGLSHGPWILQLLGQAQRRASMPFRCLQVSPEQPGIPEALFDPCPQGEVVAYLVERGREVLRRRSPSLVVRRDLPHVAQPPGSSRPVPRKLHRLLENAPRQRGVSGLVMSQARLFGPAPDVLTAVRWRGSARHLPELCRRLRGSAGSGQQGGALERIGHGDVGALDRQGQVARSFLRIVEDRG